MQVNKALILFFLVLLPLKIFSQETIARFKYEDAEKAFVAQNYQECIDNLDEAEKLLGKTAPNILHLKILAQHQLFEKNPFESYEVLESLRSNCNTYLANYDIAGLEEKYRDVYDISGQLPAFATLEEFNQEGLQYNQELEEASLERAIARNNLVFVEGDTFIMGKNRDAHEVTLNDFYMGKYEITLGQWNNYLKATDKTGGNNEELKAYEKIAVNYSLPTSSNSAFYRQVGASRVHAEYVTKVLWEEMMSYCKWLGLQYGGTWRLPTEAEWEYAVRNGNKTGGEAQYEMNELSSADLQKGKEPLVGRFSPNALGLYDMAGNVQELCYDYYDKDYFDHSPKENPMGPDNGKQKVMRGVYSSQSRNIYRRGGAATLAHVGALGFRVVYIPD